MHTEPIKVVDIIGNIRSGSTVLNILLGAHPNMVAVGEIQHITKIKQFDLTCSCGERVANCEFWPQVISHWLAHNAIDSVEAYAALQKHYEHYRKLPQAILASKRRRRGFDDYTQATRALYQAVQHISQIPVLAASTKHPARAYIINRIDGLDVRYIFLVRDVRGYAASRKRMVKAATTTPLPVWQAALSWVWTNLMCEIVMRQSPNSIMVRHEDLLMSPGATLLKIGEAIGEDMSAVSAKVDAGESVEIKHLVCGNSLRMQKTLRVKRVADTWDQILTPGEAETAWRIAGWMMKRYGYVKKSHSSIS